MKIPEYDYTLIDEDWCRDCVFEHRPWACSHDWERCKKVVKELINHLSEGTTK